MSAAVLPAICPCTGAPSMQLHQDRVIVEEANDEGTSGQVPLSRIPVRGTFSFMTS